MEKDSGQLFRELKEDISAYAETKFELFKLSSYERVGRVAGLLSYGLVLMLLAFFALLFIFFSMGFFLGDLFDSLGLGFGCIAVLYIFLMVMVFLNKKRIEDKVLNEVIDAMNTNDDEDGNDTNTPEANPSGEAARGEAGL